MKKQVYRCACFDSDCQRKALCDGRPTAASLVSDKSLSKHYAIISFSPFSNREIVYWSYLGVYECTLKTRSRSSLGNDFYIGTSITKVGRQGAENNCSTHVETDKQTLRKSIYR